VIVSLDTLEHAELEFFGTVARCLPHLPVLVYSPSGQGELLIQALELGATGPATAESLRELANRLTTPAAALPTEEIAVDEEAERLPPTPTPMAAFTVDESPTVLDDEFDLEAEPEDPDGDGLGDDELGSDDFQDDVQHDGEDDGQDDSEVPRGPVRVPWLRYADVPARSGPPTAPQSEPIEPATPSPAGGDIDKHTPLLTEEELRALMGPEEFDDGTELGQRGDEQGDDRQGLER
jgi:hypothetical protein